MTSLFDLDANSSDSEEDADYVPDGNVSDVSVSDGDLSDDEISPGKPTISRKSRKKTKQSADNSDEGSKEIEKSDTTKKKADDIWKSFLSEVEQTPEKTETAPESSSNVTLSSVTKCIAKIDSKETSSDSPKKESSNILEFAGETISVSKDGSVVDILPTDNGDSKEPKAEENGSHSSTDNEQTGKRKGLQSVLGTIMNKKQKINTLQKSLIDWKSYKKEEGIEEDLQNFNRGKGGYIERQRFLERSNVRSYELERDLRMSKAKK